ncbi:putative sporulation protein YtxC [Bacillus shivajii]|uniref:putative sporulation protein YtxC n=1 Tax=Bacillus shivajii TaxID=1983719 RepID=UPI001CF9D6B6|nr:putative sporulation protein YtxC [Bacillus shivajii]UCZ52240.1 putative sporulation protein YtxC [Bacillus shivajii]
MLTIQFKDTQLCEAFYDQLCLSLHTFVGDKEFAFIEDKGDHSFLKIDLPCLKKNGANTSQVASVLTNVTIKEKLPLWLRDWVKEGFYYEDPYEVEAIVEYAKQLFLKGSNEVPLKVSFKKWQHGIYKLYDQFIYHSLQFSFDSFLRFRLREKKEELVEVVEKAIDEYKLEHDYQVMVASCRDYLQAHEPRIHTIHLLLDQSIAMYDNHGRQITEDELRKWCSNEISFEAPLPFSEWVISPTVSLAPKKLIIYPNHNYEGLLQTLFSIFEERIEIRSEENPSILKA